LTEAGKEFAKNQPDRAQYLSITDEKKDPYVERLFEGFAFLTARIRERLEAELPEFTEDLMGLLWPHYLRPIPALAILKFAPREGKLREPLIIERDTEVLSQAVKVAPRPGMQFTLACRFRTCWNARLLPLQLEKVTLDTTSLGKHVLTLRFRLTGGAKYEKIFSAATPPPDKRGASVSEDRIRLFLNTEAPSLLLLYLTHYAKKAVVKAVNGEASAPIEILPVGFDQEDNLWPVSPHTLIGYRILQEYFAFPQKFSFIDLAGLSRLRPPAGLEAFEIQVFLDKNFPDGARFSGENFQLFCTPIVNLFADDVRPLLLSHLRPEYPIAPQSERSEIYAVEKVVGYETKTRNKHEYLPFHSFRHVSRNGQGAVQQRFFKNFSRFDPSNTLWETALAFGGHDLQSGQLPPPETVTIEATCMNDALPIKELRQRTINSPSKKFQHDVPFYNLNQPTLPVYPPRRNSLQWRLLSHMSLNFMSLTDIKILQQLLELYIWDKDETALKTKQHRIQGIREVSAKPDYLVVGRATIRGANVTIKLDDKHFKVLGDLYLFGLVLKEVFSHFATMNSFVRLTLVAESTGEMFTWSPNLEKGLPTV
jgi:type VI secretion system protein ImpG